MKCFKAKAVVPDAVVELDASYFLSVDVATLNAITDTRNSANGRVQSTRVTHTAKPLRHSPSSSISWPMLGHILKDCVTYQNNDMKLRVLLFASVFQVKLSSEL